MKRLFTVQVSVMKYLLLLITFSLVSTSYAQTPPDDLVGEGLRQWIKDNFYTGKRNVLSYSNARTAMYGTIDVREDGNVYCVYTGFNQPSENTTFLDPINAEHTVPQSWFGGEANEDLRTDIHHLYPTHGSVNSARSNNPFDEIVDSQTESWYIVNSNNTGLSVTSSIPTSNIDDYSELIGGERFEPREDHKGDLARAIFYIYTMYPGEISELSHLEGVISDIASPELLFQWNVDDPVDTWEMQRNDRTETAQGNRNPFIDNPDWIADAFLINSTASISLTADLADFGEVDNGSFSSTQEYTVSGTDLENDLIITASDNFQISKDGSTFSSSIVYPFADVNASAQTVTVRFEPISGFNGIKTGVITHASTGAANKDISVSGTETGNSGTTDIAIIRSSVDENGIPTIVGEVSVKGVFHGVNTNPGGANGFDFQFTLIDETGGINVRYDEGATNLGSYSEGDEVTVTGTVNHFNGLMQILPTAVALESSGNDRVTPDIVSELNEDTESDLVKLINVSVTSVSEWTGSSSNTTSFNVNITAGGNPYVMRIDGDTELAQMTYSEVFGSESVTSEINIIGLGGQFDTSNPRDGDYQIFPHYAADISIGASGVITTSVSELDNFGSVANGASSDVKTYTVSGSDLENDVTVTAPTYFEVSTDGTNFSSSVTLTFADVNANPQTIHVRFTPTSGSNGNVSGSIAHTSTDVVTVNVAVLGTETGNAGNTPPSDILLSNSSIDENLDDGTVVGAFTTEDVDGDDIHSYTLVNGIPDNASFAISGSNLLSETSFDHEAKSSYNIKVLTDDGNGGTFEKEFEISIGDTNDNPTDIKLSNASINEGEAIGTEIGLFSTTDEDGDDNHTYTLATGEGDDDNGSFTIDGNSLQSAEVFDSQVKSSYSIRVKTDDGNGGTYEEEYTITVLVPTSTIVAQDFESSSTDTWSYTNDPATYNVSNDMWDVVSDVNGVIFPQSGSNLWGMRDLNNPNGGGNFDHILTFDEVNISSYNNVKISFYYYTHEYESADELKYEVIEDGQSQGVVVLNDNTGDWVEVSVDVSASASTVSLKLMGKQDGGSDYAGFDNVKLNGQSIPALFTLSTSSLSDFGSVDNGSSSDAQTYTITGDGLSADVVVTAPDNFEVSSDGTNFSSSITLAFADVNASAQTIHVRFSPSTGTDGAITGEITHVSEGSSSANVSVSGTESGNVIPVITTSVSSLAAFGEVMTGENSDPKTYTVSGSDLSTDVTVTAPSQFEVSTDGTTFSSSVTLAFADVNASPQTIHVRFSPTGSSDGTISGDITHNSTGASEVTVSVTGDLITGLEDLVNIGIEVFPVPANNRLHVKVLRNTVYQVGVFDLNGRNVFSSQISNNTDLDVSGLNNGIYILKISNSSKTATMKLIIKH